MLLLVYFLLNSFILKKFNVLLINKNLFEKRIELIVVFRYFCKFLFVFFILLIFKFVLSFKKILKKNNIKMKIENKNIIKFKFFILVIKLDFFFIFLIKMFINCIVKKVCVNIEI